MLKGDLVNWDTAEFELVNMTLKEVDVSSICIPPRPGHVILPEKRSFHDHMDMCLKFRGVPSTITDAQTQTWMNNKIIQFEDCKAFGKLYQIVLSNSLIITHIQVTKCTG